MNRAPLFFSALVLLAGVGTSPPVYGEINPFIMGWGEVPPGVLGEFLLQRNPSLGAERANRIAQSYQEECLAEGINSDIAFAQMLLETSYLRYGGQVLPEQNNFAGLGAVDGGAPGLSFDQERTGIRAHIQHLKAYGSRLPLVRPLVNPRFPLVVREAAPTVFELSRRWASDPGYGEKIMALIGQIRAFQGLGQDPAGVTL